DHERQDDERHHREPDDAGDGAADEATQAHGQLEATVSCEGRARRISQPAIFQTIQIGRTTKRKILKATMPSVMRKNNPARSMAPTISTRKIGSPNRNSTN